MATAAFRQTIPHTGTQLPPNYKQYGGPVVVDRSSCCRGFHNTAHLEWNTNNAIASRRSLRYVGYLGVPDCGTTDEGAKVYTTAVVGEGFFVTTDCYTFTFSLLGTSTVNQQTGDFLIGASGIVGGGLTALVSASIDGTLTSFAPLAGSYSGTTTGGVISSLSGSFTGSGAGQSGTTTWSLSTPQDSIATGNLRFTYPSLTENFSGSHTGSGTITGATYSGSGTGNLTGDYAGAYAFTVSGNLTSADPDGDFEIDFTGAFEAHVEGTITNGVFAITSYSITTPTDGFLLTFSPSFTIGGGGTTFTFSGSFTANVKHIRAQATVKGRGGVMHLYEHLTISHCGKGGAYLEIRDVADEMVAVYQNIHHGMWKNQDSTDLYLVEKVGCTPGFCPWKIYGNNGWPQVIGLRMASNAFVHPGNPCEGGTEGPPDKIATVGTDGSGIGSVWNGFTSDPVHAQLCGISAPFSGSLIPSSSFDFTDANRISVAGFENVEYEETGTLTVIQSVGPDTYSGSLNIAHRSYGPAILHLSMTFDGRLELARTRVDNGFVDYFNVTRWILTAVYAGQFDDICGGAAMDLTWEGMHLFATGLTMKRQYPAPFPMLGNHPDFRRVYPSVQLNPTTCSVSPA